MTKGRRIALAAGLGLSIAALGIGQAALEASTQAQQTVQAPRFEVDPLWPKPLPNNWVIGSTIGIGVDSKDHVFIVHRQATVLAGTEAGAAANPPVSVCC